MKITLQRWISDFVLLLAIIRYDYIHCQPDTMIISEEEHHERSSDSSNTNSNENNIKTKSIAIIGGGISGTFVTKYLVDYDINCSMFHSITIFEPYPVNTTIKHNSSTTTMNNTTTSSTATMTQYYNQGSRIATYEMEDGTMIELGASILYKDFHLVLEMIHSNDEDHLAIGVPYTTGIHHHTIVQSTLQNGTGVYDGNGLWSLLLTSTKKYTNDMTLLLRYHRDLYLLSRLCQRTIQQFLLVPQLLQYHTEHFFDSPFDIWHHIGLSKYIQHSFDQILDAVGISPSSSSIITTDSGSTIQQNVWKKYFTISYWYQYIWPYHGSIRTELLTAINLVNYNQDNTQVNGIVGLGSFATAIASSSLFSIVGGNYQIILLAYKQAVLNRHKFCIHRTDQTSPVQQITKRITTVVGDLNGFALFGENDEYIGEYDIVILAVPIQQCQITFLIQSQMDHAILQPMPLNGRIPAHTMKKHDMIDHDGHDQLPSNLPDSAIRPYVQVVTTIVKNATLNASMFHLHDPNELPRSIMMTLRGKYLTYNITGITQITNHVYKVFSNEPLHTDILKQLFGARYILEYEKIWGGPYGGATPNYQGGIDNATDFLLYDSAIGYKGHTSSGGLYYTNAMEQCTLSSMEISAIGAKAVSKLIAERVGLIQPRIQTLDVHDEL